MIKWGLFMMSAVFYYYGSICYRMDKKEYTVFFALGCAISFYLFLKRLRENRYLHMSMKKIDKLSGKAFEEYLMVQFKRMGYRVKATEDSHDYGADLILKKRKTCIVVQAKRYEKNIGISAIQEVVGSIAYYEADKAMVVTNRYFTKSAQNLAMQNGVELWNREVIRKKFHIRG